MRTALTILAGVLMAGAALLALAAVDFTLNRARVLYALIGRDALVAVCRPKVAEDLVRRGFVPTDIAFDDRPSIEAVAGRGRSMRADFTFTDGIGGVRVDGTATCIADGAAVRVHVETRSSPHRTA